MGKTKANSGEDEWRVETDLRTLIDAEQIEKDPKRFKAARELAKKRLIEIASVAGGEGCE